MSTQQFPSAVRNATLVGDDNAKNIGNVGVKAVLRVTAVPGTDTVTLIIEGKDKASGTYYTILQAAARSAAGTDVLTIYPGVAVTANVSASDVLPNVYRARVIHSAGTNFTYSLGLDEF